VSATSTPNLIAAVVEHFGARRTGPGRWIARCPAHSDRSPSLSIAEGRGGRVLLHCWAGCDLAAILKSAELSIGNLFASGPATTREQIATLDRKRERHLVALREERWTVERMRLSWQSLSYELPLVARKLMFMPEDAPGAAALTTHLHRVLSAMRTIDCALLGDPD
jgi:hypothetical protein